MSWLSQALDRNKLGVLNKIAKPIQAVANPIINNIPVVGAVKQGLEAVGDYIPGGPKGADPVPFSDTANAALTGGGASGLDWLRNALGGLSGKDVLSTLGGGITAATNYAQNKAAIEERKREFDRTQGQSEGKDAVMAQNLLNRAPLADEAQYLLKARMSAPPTAFTPRDWTRTGMTQATMQSPATGGPATQLAAGQQAAASYTPGAGGVDTSVLQLLKQRMMKSSGLGA